MMIVRAVKQEDFNAVWHCASIAGIGITNLPKRIDILEQQLNRAYHSFNKEIRKPANEEYFFVLAKHDSKVIGGTCGIHAKVGNATPYYSFKVTSLPPPPLPMPPPDDSRILQIKEYRNGPTEVCALYLLPHFRQGGLGKLLSLSRFLFIATFPQRFEKTIFANMRGTVDHNLAPFWDGTCRHFLNISYEEIMQKRAASEEFFKEFLPKFPIYAALLPEEARNAIGKTHIDTTPALKILQNEGFQNMDEIDPIDGGPLVFAEASNIKTVKESRQATVKNIIASSLEEKKFIICNQSLDFRACYGSIIQLPNDQVAIDVLSAEGLQIEIGKTVRYIELYKG